MAISIFRNIYSYIYLSTKYIFRSNICINYSKTKVQILPDIMELCTIVVDHTTGRFFMTFLFKFMTLLFKFEQQKRGLDMNIGLFMFRNN
jgi:hypothetical protein